MTNVSETLASMVTNNHQIVRVLEKYNIDFCCKGKRTLAQACTEKGIKVESITEELNALSQNENKQLMPFVDMSAEQLISYILIHHHFYVKQSMPTILSHLNKVATKHGDSFPYMKKVYDLFLIIMKDMIMHMGKEEANLFPLIKEAEIFSKTGIGYEIEKGQVQSLINTLEAEHEKAGDILYQIRELTNNYNPPTGACTTFKVSLEELREFESNLHQHVHLENNILFQKAIEFENSFHSVQ